MQCSLKKGKVRELIDTLFVKMHPTRHWGSALVRQACNHLRHATGLLDADWTSIDLGRV